MKNLKKSQFPNTELINKLTKWSFLFLSAIAVCFITGCRLFTVGG